MSTIDLNTPPPDHEFKLSIDPKETGSERKVRLFKDVALFVMALGFVVIIAWLCIRTLLLPTALPEEKKWAMSVLSAATGGIIGYLIRK